MMTSRGYVFIKELLYVFVVILLVMLIFGALIHINMSAAMKKQMGDMCFDIASDTAILIEHDIEGYEEFCRTLDTNSTYYQGIKKALERIRYARANHICFIYTEKRVSENEMMFVLHGEHEDSEMFSPPGTRRPLTDVRREAYETEGAVIGGNFYDAGYGLLLSAYAAVKNPETGAFIGLVGCDVSIEQYKDVMKWEIRLIWGSVVFLLATVFLTLFYSSGRFEKMIACDQLTGLYNKTYFLKMLRYELKQKEKMAYIPISVLMIDFDKFKEINDTYGHQFGDLALKHVTKTIDAVLRKYDCFARYGGDEFIAYLVASYNRAMASAERIRKMVAETPLHNAETNTNVFFTLSIGVSECQPGQSMEDVLKSADEAVYRAKRTRNAVAGKENS